MDRNFVHVFHAALTDQLQPDLVTQRRESLRSLKRLPSQGKISAHGIARKTGEWCRQYRGNTRIDLSKDSPLLAGRAAWHMPRTQHEIDSVGGILQRRQQLWQFLRRMLEIGIHHDQIIAA